MMIKCIMVAWMGPWNRKKRRNIDGVRAIVNNNISIQSLVVTKVVLL